MEPRYGYVTSPPMQRLFEAIRDLVELGAKYGMLAAELEIADPEVAEAYDKIEYGTVSGNAGAEYLFAIAQICREALGLREYAP